MIELRTLGSLALAGDVEQDPARVLSRAKCIALLSYLAAATPVGFHRRDKLVSIFWPEADERHARASLRKAIYGLRRCLGADLVVGRGAEELALDATRLWCDAVAFHSAAEAGRNEEVMRLYGGDFLDGLHVSGAPDFSHWAELERDLLRRRAARSAWQLAEVAEEQDDPRAAVRWARRCMNLLPYDEGCLRRLLRLYDRYGERAAALQAFERFEKRLAEDLDLRPSAEALSLVRSLRSRGGSAGPSSANPDEARLSTDGVAVAVLPFACLADDPEQRQLTDGLHEEVMRRLAGQHWARVTSRTSVMRFRDRSLSVGDIASSLGVGLLVEGSVRFCEGRVRVSAAVIDAPTDRQVWTGTYQVPTSASFTWELDLAAMIVQGLATVLHPEQSSGSN